MILKHYKGMTLLSLLITLSIFSTLFISINQWLAFQRQRANQIYHAVQVMQIAENQKQRQFLKLGCDVQVKQNRQLFQIRCSPEEVTVSSPFAKITL